MGGTCAHTYEIVTYRQQVGRIIVEFWIIPLVLFETTRPCSHSGVVTIMHKVKP